MSMDERLREQIDEIRQRLCAVYHISEEEAYKRLAESSFYRVLADDTSDLLRDGMEVNFLRFQNEIEYGRWDL